MASKDYIEAQNQEKNKVTSCFKVISPKTLQHTETTQWTCTSNKLIDFCIRHDPSNAIRHLKPFKSLMETNLNINITEIKRYSMS